MKQLTLLTLALALQAHGQNYTILTDRPQQTIEHFGASDAWSMQTIGLWVRYMKRIRQQLHDKLKERDAEFWQTELCIMSNDEEIGGGGGYDFTMKTGLYVARVIHHDLVYGHAKSWSWWRACGGNYKDGLIRVFDRRHTAKDSRLLWCLGNYSRFVRPDAVRYEVSSPKKENPYGVMVSAYRNDDRSWVVVAINYSNKEQPFTVCLGSPEAKVSWQPYRTSDKEGETLKPLAPIDGSTTLAPRSITTFVSE